MHDLTALDLRSLLDYNPQTGLFVWTNAARSDHVGKVAGYICEGYRNITVRGRLYKAHRLAWLHAHGRWPDGQIDHINGSTDDNRIANPRDCSHAQNRQNLRRSYRNNSARLLGASFDNKVGKWRSQIQVSGRKEHIGYFDSAERGHEAYVQRKREIHSHGTL